MGTLLRGRRGYFVLRWLSALGEGFGNRGAIFGGQDPTPTLSNLTYHIIDNDAVDNGLARSFDDRPSVYDDDGIAKMKSSLSRAISNQASNGYLREVTTKKNEKNHLAVAKGWETPRKTTAYEVTDAGDDRLEYLEQRYSDLREVRDATNHDVPTDTVYVPEEYYIWEVVPVEIPRIHNGVIVDTDTPIQ